MLYAMQYFCPTGVLLIVYCPGLQWRHQLDLFSNALQTGQLDVRAFGLEFQVCPEL